MEAGRLDYRVAFDQPVSTPNGQGGTIQGWQERVQCFAAFRYLRGGETVQAARLEGRQPVVVSIRMGTVEATIRTDWRMRDVRSGAVYNVRSIVPTDTRDGLELLVEGGVAV